MTYIINPHQEGQAVEERRVREDNEARVHDNHVQHDVRIALGKLGPKIREMKKFRDQPGQPGWANSNLGVELEQARGLATVLCVSRSKHRNPSRVHPVVLPQVIHLPPEPGKVVAKVYHINTLVELKRLSDEQVALRFAVAPTPPKAA